MKKALVRIMLCCVLQVLLISLPAWAVPELINYEGKLTDTEGISLNGTYDINFKIYSAVVGGDALWTESQSVTAIDGIFHVLLGSVVPFAQGLFENNELYLEVIISGKVLSPRQRFTSSAFAIRAKDADTVDGKHANELCGGGAGDGNPIPTAYWPDFDETAPYLLRNALWVGWDDSKKAWKYTRESDNDRGVTDPGDPATWVVNGKNTGYFDGDLDTLPPGTHMNNRYNPRMMAYRCNQDDIQVKMGSFWIDKYACRIIDVGPDYTGTTWKDDTEDMTTSANTDVSPFWMAFSQRARASTGMTWFVAAQASVNAGKRLPDNAVWQASALGTARSSGNGIESGSDWTTVMDQDVSRYGVVGMAGNLWEWVADWIQAGRTWQSSDGQNVIPWPSGKGYGDDQTWNINGRAYNISSWVNGAPAAPLRGGSWGSGSGAGVFDLSTNHAPSDWRSGFGFRSAR